MYNLLLYRMPVGEWIEVAINWLKDNIEGFFDVIKDILSGLIDFFEFIYTFLPVWAVITIFAIIALRTAGVKTMIFTVLGFLLVYFMALFEPAMKTLAMISTATLLAVVIGIPLGIWTAKSKAANKIIKPILDFMQTMPSFVYLIPAVYFFGLGTASGTIATVIFAMPPIVRLTYLGIKQVPKEVVEVASAFGATPTQKLWKVQMPLAMPSILAGLNQTIMLSLSMVVVAAMISAGGLGQVVYSGIGQMKIGQGFEGGLAVVIVAMFLDKVTQSAGKKNKGVSFIAVFKKIAEVLKKLKKNKNKDTEIKQNKE